MQAAEREVEKLTKDVAKIDIALADPKLYDDASKAQRLALDRGRLAKQLAVAEDTWLHATDTFERAQSEAA